MTTWLKVTLRKHRHYHRCCWCRSRWRLSSWSRQSQWQLHSNKTEPKRDDDKKDLFLLGCKMYLYMYVISIRVTPLFVIWRSWFFSIYCTHLYVCCLYVCLCRLSFDEHRSPKTPSSIDKNHANEQDALITASCVLYIKPSAHCVSFLFLFLVFVFKLTSTQKNIQSEQVLSLSS